MPIKHTWSLFANFYSKDHLFQHSVFKLMNEPFRVEYPRLPLLLQVQQFYVLFYEWVINDRPSNETNEHSFLRRSRPTKVCRNDDDDCLFHTKTYHLIFISLMVSWWHPSFFGTYWRTYLLTPCSRGLPEKLISPQLFRKFLEFYGTRRFITAFITARHLSLFWARPIQTVPHPISWKYILILSYHLCVLLKHVTDYAWLEELLTEITSRLLQCIETVLFVVILRKRCLWNMSKDIRWKMTK